MVDECHVLRRVFDDEHSKFFVHYSDVSTLGIFFAWRNRVKCCEMKRIVLHKLARAPNSECPNSREAPNFKLQRRIKAASAWSFRFAVFQPNIHLQMDRTCVVLKR